MRTDFIRYVPGQRGKKDIKKVTSIDAKANLDPANKLRPESAKSAVTQQTFKTMTQISGPTNFTSDAKATEAAKSQTIF